MELRRPNSSRSETVLDIVAEDLKQNQSAHDGSFGMLKSFDYKSGDKYAME